MTVEITCPHCNLSRKIPREKVPPGTRWATCPRCKERFEFFPAVPEFDPATALKPRPEERKEKVRPSISLGAVTVRLSNGSASTLSTPREPRGGDLRFAPSSTGDNRGVDVERVQETVGAEAGRSLSPWENRSELGLLKGIILTLKSVVFSPKRFFSTTTYSGGIREPMAFGLLSGAIGMMLVFFWQFLAGTGDLFSGGASPLEGFGPRVLFLGVIALCPFLVAVNLFVASAIVHLLLRVVRGRGHGFEATFRVISYSQATQLWGLVPFVGGLIGGLWLVVVAIIGLHEIHGISYLKIILALLIPLALILLLVVGILMPLVVFG